MLLGFSNTMVPGRPSPAIIAEFRDHKADGTVDELIGGKSFFTPSEFGEADHHISGHFDEFGQFSGTVSVYRQEPREHVIQWPRSSGRRTECGPFSVSFAYVQGQLKDSRLPPDEYTRLSAKLNRIGGLYVYRDGIRILPYGNSDYDFLNIERRRTKSASDWFFSYRRIFGVVEITNRDNANLVEKAGREGFRANKAYREFASILENFFQRLAIDFFRETAPHGDEFQAIRKQLNREVELLKAREKTVRGRKKEFSDRLEGFFSALEGGRPLIESNRIRMHVVHRIEHIASIHDPDEAVQAILEIETELKAETARLERSFSISKPRGVGLSKELQADWAAYQQNFQALQREVIDPLREELGERLSQVASQRGIKIDRRKEFRDFFETKKSSYTAAISRLRREISGKIESLGSGVSDSLTTSFSETVLSLEEVAAEFGRTDLDAMPDEQARTVLRDWEQRIDRATSASSEMLEALSEQLGTLIGAVSRRETLDETTAAIESYSEALKDELDTYVELAQVGMALGIVQHEFSNTIKRVRNAIRRLEPWAEGTPELGVLYRDMRSGFDHLDSYLRLFTPMSRRLAPQDSELTGREINTYLREIFEDRLGRENITMQVSPAFEAVVLKGAPSTFLPCFVNIIENAIYWLATIRGKRRLISLDTDGDSIAISNNGPGIETRLAEAIFEYGVSSRPGGRGLGLYLSREALRKAGYDLKLKTHGVENSPRFLISKVVNEHGAEG